MSCGDALCRLDSKRCGLALPFSSFLGLTFLADWRVYLTRAGFPASTRRAATPYRLMLAHLARGAYASPVQAGAAAQGSPPAPDPNPGYAAGTTPGLGAGSDAGGPSGSPAVGGPGSPATPASGVEGAASPFPYTVTPAGTTVALCHDGGASAYTAAAPLRWQECPPAYFYPSNTLCQMQIKLTVLLQSR